MLELTHYTTEINFEKKNVAEGRNARNELGTVIILLGATYLCLVSRVLAICTRY